MANAEDFQKAYENLSEEDKKFLFFRIGNKAAKLQPEQLLPICSTTLTNPILEMPFLMVRLEASVQRISIFIP